MSFAPGPRRDRTASDGLLALLRNEFGEAAPSGQPRVLGELEQVQIPAAEPIAATVIEAAGGSEAFSDAHEDRVRHATGRSYPDLVRLRSGVLDQAPDAVITPAGPEAVAATLRACAASDVAVVPFGGGTSVVGGVAPLRGRRQAVISLDLARLQRVEVDRHSLTARLGAGLRGPEAEAALAADGLTLGHFPQSYQYATIGGFAATRSAGQASSGYGRFDDLVTGLSMQTPLGPVATLESPHSAAGPALRQLYLGSEGVLGVISEVTVRVRPVPARRRYEAWMIADFEAGREACRALAQSDLLPDVLRLSDPEETRIALASSTGGGLARRAFSAYLGLRGRRSGCMVIAGFEGSGERVADRRARAARVLRSHGAAALGKAAGVAWERGRFDAPYLRDTLLSIGVMAETLETAHTWSGLQNLYEEVGAAIRRALSDSGTPGLVMCHVSHVYRDGASLYFTVIAPQLGFEADDGGAAAIGPAIGQWSAVKSAAAAAILACGATITHHHAVGSDHSPYLSAEVGDRGMSALRALKASFDPAGIMNPGKLLS